MKFFALIMIGLLNVGCSDSPKCETPVCMGDSANNSTNNSTNGSNNGSTNNSTTGECSFDTDCELGTVCTDKTCVTTACDFCTADQVCLVTDIVPTGSCSAPECATNAECADRGGVCTFGLCGAPTTVDVSEFDQTCDNDTDCALVNPSPCGCSCPEIGINTSAATLFDVAVAAITCTQPSPVCAPCEAKLPACWESTCRARSPQVVKAEDFDNSCVTAADCTTIWVGEICGPCQCPSEVVNLADYEANRPTSAECTPAPVQCLCAQPPALACKNGVCDFER